MIFVMKKDDIIETFNLLQTDEKTKKVFDADISARIPYRLHCCVYNFDRVVWEEDDILYNYDLGGNCQTLKILREHGACLMYYQIRPYLRPMSSMTEDEKNELHNNSEEKWANALDFSLSPVSAGEVSVELESIAEAADIDWLYSHHFDFRGLIEKGLAIEAPEDMYKD